MANTRLIRQRRHTVVPLDAVSTTRPSSLTAAAQVLDPRIRRPYNNEEWQIELWNFYRDLGEFNFGVTWFSEGLSRIRLTAARMKPGGDEPEIITEGPIAEAVSQLGGGIGGQAAMMRNLAIQLSVPGDCYLVGKDDIFTGKQTWEVKSLEEIRVSTVRKTESWEVRVDENLWEPLPSDSLVIRIWQPDPQFGWKAMSHARSALNTMRTLDLLNRRVTAQILSRLASNGFLVYPEEVTFPVRDEFKDAPDPFIAELIDIASKAVENPGSPASAIPLPLRVPAEYIEKFTHLTFANELDEKITEYREYETRRLATSLRLPGEIILGRGDTNHWGMWQLEEESIKLYFSTTAELICDAFTKGFLHPTLRAMGLDVSGEDGDIIVWYDTSELAIRPDKSSDAITLYKMGEMSPSSLRREVGFDEGDAPDRDDLEEMIMKRVIFGGGTAAGYSNLVINAALQLAGVELKSLETVADPSELIEGPGESEPDVGIPASEQDTEPIRETKTPTTDANPTVRVTPPPPPTG
jgi:hypothetical protein